MSRLQQQRSLAQSRCRVGRAVTRSRPLARAGRGDVLPPALPLMWLVASLPHPGRGFEDVEEATSEACRCIAPSAGAGVGCDDVAMCPRPASWRRRAHHPRCRGHGRRSHCRGLVSASGARRAAPASAGAGGDGSSRRGTVSPVSGSPAVRARHPPVPLAGSRPRAREPNESQGAGPVPLWCGVGGRRTGNQRGLSGCRASPQRPRRWSRTATTRRASSCRSHPRRQSSPSRLRVAVPWRRGFPSVAHPRSRPSCP